MINKETETHKQKVERMKSGRGKEIKKKKKRGGGEGGKGGRMS